jgi:hypothetical protein
MKVNGSAVIFSPRYIEIQTEFAPSAISRSGIALASAPKMRLGRKWPIRWRAPTGAGNVAFRMQPSGAVTWTGRKLPSLCGISGEIAAFTAKLV